MKLTRVSTFTASLLVLAMGAQILAACDGADPDLVEAGPEKDGGKSDGSPDSDTNKPVEAGPDAPVVIIEAGPDGDADADAGPPTTPVQSVVGLVSIAIEQSRTKAAIGTLVPLTIKATFADKTGAKKTIDFKDYDQLDISVGADLFAIPTRDFGGLGLLAQKKGIATFKVTEKKTGLSASGTLEVSDAKLTSVGVRVPTMRVAKGLFLNAYATAYFDDKSEQDVTRLAAFSFKPSDAIEALEGAGNNGVFKTLKSGQATVTATSGGMEGRVEFDITAAEVASVAFAKPFEKIALRTLSGLHAEATMTDGSKEDVTANSKWTTSNAGVLLVDEAGLVTAAGLGTATITVTTANGKTASTTITVTEATLEKLSVVAADETGAPIDTLSAGKTRRLALKGELSDQSIVDLTQNAAWSSKEPTFLSVDNDKVKGLLTAKKAGDAVIVVKYGEKPAIEVAVKVVAAN